MTDKDIVFIVCDIVFLLTGVVGFAIVFYFLDKRMDKKRKEKIEKILDLEIQLGQLRATRIAEEDVMSHIRKVGDITKQQAELIFELEIQDFEGNLGKLEADIVE